jgi:hypothetical protein
MVAGAIGGGGSDDEWLMKAIAATGVHGASQLESRCIGGRWFTVDKPVKSVRAIIAGLLSAALLTALVPASSAQAATQTKIVKYGPISLAAGSATSPTTDTRLRFLVQRPCVDCYITSFTPDLVYTNGSKAVMNPDGSGVMLHHAVFASQWQRDATYYNEPLGLAGERFFASGNERSVVKFPNGYGYRVRYYDSWTLLTDVMSHSTVPVEVYLQVTYTHRPSWEG